MKKVVALVLSLLVVFAFAGCGGGGGSDSGDKTVIHFGSTVATTHPWYKAAEEFKKDVEEKSGGAIEVALDFGGVHGSDKEHVEAASSGTLDMQIDSTVGVDAVVTKLGFVNLPYLMTSFDEVDQNFYNGWMSESCTKLVEEQGITVLGWTDCDFRWMTNSKHPIKKVEDLKGMKMRVPEAPMYLKFFENLGCTPTSIAFNDLPSALQQKVVDGQDNGPILTYTAGLNQFQKYMTETNHAFAPALVGFNTAKLESLPEDQQKIIKECGTAYAEKVKELVRAEYEADGKAMAETSEIIEVTPELDKAMRAAAEKVWQDKEVTKNFDQDAVNKILEEAGLK